MDRLLYVSMTGTHRVMEAQARNAQNLANATTTAFKGALDSAAPQKIEGPGMPARYNVQTRDSRPDLLPGMLQSTGRALDVAVQGNGWLVVQDANGDEALTRRGDLQVDANGLLRTGDGSPVLGDMGPIAIPPYKELFIGVDGTLSIVPLGQGPQAQGVLDRIMLVTPENPETLVRGPDGLFRTADGEVPEPDAGVRLLTGNLEASNVNMARAMVEMIELARHFEMQVRMMRTADENADSAAQLMRLG